MTSYNFLIILRVLHLVACLFGIQATALELKNLFVAGKRKEALRHAQQGQMWGPALVLA